jgi:hypothetical protein
MAVLTLTVNETVYRVDTDDLTLGFYEDLERAQETGKMRDFIPVLSGMLSIEPANARAITLRQWREIAEAMQAGAAVPPTSA